MPQPIMDESTDGVTLLSGFVFDVLNEYESMRALCKPAFEMAAHLDPKKPEALTDIKTYNAVCAWIETHVGQASVRNAGRAIGDRAYDAIVKANKLSDNTPLGVMEALCWAASTLIQDPKKRGWEIAEQTQSSITMRRTQTFNCILQEGMLLSFLERTRVQMPGVVHETCRRRGDAFCTYRCTWIQTVRLR
jgi:hypothetical protein